MPKWISVTEQMPKDGERVIGYDEFYDRVGEVVLSSWGKHLEFVDSQKDDCSITHWMPFPKQRLTKRPPDGAVQRRKMAKSRNRPAANASR